MTKRSTMQSVEVTKIFSRQIKPNRCPANGFLNPALGESEEPYFIWRDPIQHFLFNCIEQGCSLAGSWRAKENGWI
jgi:hypothetical protein